MFSPHTLSRAYSRPTKALAVLVVSLGLPSAAMAQDSDVSFYAGAAVEFVELNSFAGDSIDLFGENTSAVALRGGALFNRHFAAEGEIAFGVENRDGDGIADYNSRFAAYGRVRAPFGETGFEIFARAGYAITNIESRNVIGDDGASGADGSSLDGITYGGGFAYNFGARDRFQLRLDYTEFNFGNDQDADTVSIGVGYNF